MTIVNPLASANLVVQSALATIRPEERHSDLRIEQIIRATVVEGGLDRAMLELNHQRFRIQSEQELKTGQQLELQVLTTHPKLTFKVLAVPVEARLAALLPLLAKPFDWHGLIKQFQKSTVSPPDLTAQVRTVAAAQPEALRQVVDQLAILLRPASDLPAGELSAVANRLIQLKSSETLFSVANGPSLASAFDRVISTLNRQLETFDLPQQLKLMAGQIRQHPELVQQFRAVGQERAAALLFQLEQPQNLLEPRQARLLATELKTMLMANPTALPQGLTRATQKLGYLLQQPTVTDAKLTPALIGHIHELVGQLQIAVQSKPDWPQNLHQLVEQILTVMRPMTAEPEILAHGQKLGILSQLFGLNLEAELLRGRSRDALNSLKMALLGNREQLGQKGEEALHRLELFQVCRSCLSEQNLTFVPLPLPFLEEGFLFYEEGRQRDDEQEKESETAQMSVYLRLSALGNLRIDMLSEPAGMLMRVACEDQQRAAYLQSLSERLKERLQELPIRGISFTGGAESPARALLDKMIPRSRGMLDARV